MHQAITETQLASMPEGDLAAKGIPNPLASRELGAEVVSVLVVLG